LTPARHRQVQAWIAGIPRCGCLASRPDWRSSAAAIGVLRSWKRLLLGRPALDELFDQLPDHEQLVEHRVLHRRAQRGRGRHRPVRTLGPGLSLRDLPEPEHLGSAPIIGAQRLDQRPGHRPRRQPTAPQKIADRRVRNRPYACLGDLPNSGRPRCDMQLLETARPALPGGHLSVTALLVFVISRARICWSLDSLNIEPTSDTAELVRGGHGFSLRGQVHCS
jgi:hypothetical protein